MSAHRPTWIRERLLAGVLLAVVFAAGALTSAAVLRIAEADPTPPTPGMRGEPPTFRGGPPGRGGRGGGGLAPDLAENLALSEAQRAEVGRILEAHRERSREILVNMEPLLAAQLDSARAAIRNVLGEEQRAQFDAYLEQHRGFMERRFGGGRGGPDRRRGRP